METLEGLAEIGPQALFSEKKRGWGWGPGAEKGKRDPAHSTCSERGEY